MSDFIVGIEIDENKADSYFTFKIVRLVWDEESGSWANRTTLSRQFSHWGDCVELLHDKIMCWMQENKCVENWSEDCAEDRFNRTDYYEGKQDTPKIRYDIFPELEVEVDA